MTLICFIWNKLPRHSEFNFMDDLSALLSNHSVKKCLPCVGVLYVWLPVHYLWLVIAAEFASACPDRKRHYTQTKFASVFFCPLIIHVCSNNLALCKSIIQVTSRAPHKPGEQRLLGLPSTSFDFFPPLFGERKRLRNLLKISCLCPVCDTTYWRGLEGSWL